MDVEQEDQPECEADERLMQTSFVMNCFSSADVLIVDNSRRS